MPGKMMAAGAERNTSRLTSARAAQGPSRAGLGRSPTLLPGAHAKSLRIGGGPITRLRTVRTGELFAAVSAHAILSATLPRPVSPGDEATGFGEGLAVARALDRPGDLVDAPFSISARALCGRLAQGAAQGFLSGLRIAAEVTGATEDDPVTIIAAPPLAWRNAWALATAGRAHDLAPPDCAAAGLFIIARSAGLVAGDRRC